MSDGAKARRAEEIAEWMSRTDPEDPEAQDLRQSVGAELEADPELAAAVDAALAAMQRRKEAARGGHE